LRRARWLPLGERYLGGEKGARLGGRLAGGQLGEYSRGSTPVACRHPGSSGLLQRYCAGITRNAGSPGLCAACDGQSGCR
jgi:hypothetical protein